MSTMNNYYCVNKFFSTFNYRGKVSLAALLILRFSWSYSLPWEFTYLSYQIYLQSMKEYLCWDIRLFFIQKSVSKLHFWSLRSVIIGKFIVF